MSRSSSDPIVELVNQLTRLPGIGERTATRLAFHLAQCTTDLPAELAEALQRIATEVQPCSTCGNLSQQDPCRFCADEERTASLICVVERTSDIFAIERTGEFRGSYHVLQGLLRPLDGVGPDQLNLRALVSRIQPGQKTEVIIATNPSVEGEATAMYIRNLLTPLGARVTRIASGLPIGGELEYADRATLGRALSARREF